MTKMKLYKVLGEQGEAINGGGGTWHLDGTWMPPIEGELVPCENGYHLCRREDVIEWLGPTIHEADYRGELVEHSNKVVVREACAGKKLNWDETTARLFAIDCAEHVMHLGDEVILSSVLAIVYLYTTGEATEDDLYAARDAVQIASWAARDAAQIASWAARDATWEAARAGATWAAREAAWNAAWDAERAWQTNRLFEYLEAGGER